MVEESPYRARRTRSNRAVQWRGAVHILGVRICAGFDKARNRRGLRCRIPPGRTRTSERGRMKWFTTAPVLGSDVGSPLD